MPKLRNGNNGDSNPGSLGCESGILPTELPRSTYPCNGSGPTSGPGTGPSSDLTMTLTVGMTSDFFKLLTLLFFQVHCEELKETIQENFT